MEKLRENELLKFLSHLTLHWNLKFKKKKSEIEKRKLDTIIREPEEK